MRVVIAGGHGKIALLTAERLVRRGDEVRSLVRNADHLDEIRAVGAEPALADLETISAVELAALVRGFDAVVFAAGAGAGSGIARKDTVDRGGAVVLADAAERAGVRRYLLVSSMGVDTVRDGATPDGVTPDGVDEVFVAYLRAKWAAEQNVRRRDLDWTILRPGRLTDDAGTGRVTLTPDAPRGDVPRADVAAVLVALLDVPGSAGAVLQLTTGDHPVESTVRDMGDS